MQHDFCGLPFTTVGRAVHVFITDKIKKHEHGRDSIDYVQKMGVRHAVRILIESLRPIDGPKPCAKRIGSPG